MSRDVQQAARLIQSILRQTRGRGGWKLALLLTVGALAYGFVIQPYAEQSLGISLPRLFESTERAPTSERSTPPREPSTESAPPFDPADLAGVLEEVGRGAYRSEGGLRYTRGSQHGHRLAHLMAHTRDAPDRAGQHGVFDTTDPASVVRLVDEAYLQAERGEQTRTRREHERTIHTVDLGRKIGYIGGLSGGRRGHPSASHLRLVIEGDRLITAFPVRP